MQVFKTNKKVFLRNQLTSWVGTISFALLLYFSLKLFTQQPIGRILVPVFLLILWKLRNTLTQFYVKEIKIDEQANQLTFLLHSVMGGQRIRNYDLRQIKSEITINSGFAYIFSSPVTLEVTLPTNENFRLNRRYGLSTETLTSVDNALKKSSTRHARDEAYI